MKKRKADSRIPRTRAAIRKAYLGLLGQKEASEITVTDIAQEAALDRKTIYNYYASPAAILEELEDEVFYLCRSLKEAEIPASVTKLGRDVFIHSGMETDTVVDTDDGEDEI